MLRNKSEFVISALLVIMVATGVKAGGPLFMWNAEQRIPYRWDVTTPVSVYTDIGPFEVLPANPPAGTILVTNEIADATVAFAAAQWTDVPTSSFQAQVVGDFASIGLPDVKNAATAAQVINVDNGGGIHVIYDADRKVMQEFFGASSSVLGIASPEWADETTGTITEGWVVINAFPRWFSDNNLEYYAGVFTHEFGHAINLAHSQTNGAILLSNDQRGPLGCSTLPYGSNVTNNEIETMYPFINQRVGTGTGLAQSIVDVTEDKAAISDLYPAPGYPQTHGSITGRILRTNGRDGITGVNVIARNLENPYADAVSAMSGDYVRVAAGDDGTFTINGLTPGARYVLYTDVIVRGGFPTQQPFFIPGSEEFYNGENESGNGLSDDPCQFEQVTAVAGLTTEADVTLNSIKGAPPFIPLALGTAPKTISSDGRIVGGSTSSGGVFRWTAEGGYEVLNNTVGSGAVMSRDGTAFASETSGPNGRVASLLHYGGTWQQLPLPVATPPIVVQTCDSVSSSWGISAFGRSVTGFAWVDTNGPLPGQGCRAHPFLWTPETGSTFLPIPANTRSARANNMSDDGSTIVGWYDVNGPRLGARWVNGQVTEFSTPTLTVGEAVNVTPDGFAIVGANAGPNTEPWLWTSSGGLQVLNKIAPNFIAIAGAVSDDARIVAGLGGSTSLFPGDLSGRKAFLWTPELGSVDLEQFLRAQGTYFDSWILNTVNSMSGDGMTLLGSGFSPFGTAGWIVKLDKLNICHASPGKPANAQTINVTFRDGLGDHLNHGDTIGLCTDSE